jgi:hypothetical protein
MSPSELQKHPGAFVAVAWLIHSAGVLLLVDGCQRPS